MSSLDELRQKIDTLDTQLVNLFNERAEVVIEVGKFKRKEKGAPAIYAPDREKKVFEKIKAANNGPLPDITLQAIYRELMSGSFYLEKPLRIAHLGPKGSFSHQAANIKFGKSVEYESLSTIADVFNGVDRKHCDLGIVPIENSISGGVVETLDALIHSSAIICAEMQIAIEHNLLSSHLLNDIKIIYSKAEIFTQCRQWLAATLPHVKIIATSSSAEAARIASETPNAAAIGSRLAGELYQLNIICDHIEDVSNNVTRFLIIGKQPTRATGNDKTSIIFCTAHKVGALADVLQTFQQNDINLTNIESRPSKKREREYYFFVDIQGHKENKEITDTLDKVREHCLQLSILGSYPCNNEVQ